MGHKGNPQIAGFDCRNFPVESGGLGAAHNAWPEIDQVSAIINHYSGTRARTVRIRNRCAGAEKHHFGLCRRLLLYLAFSAKGDQANEDDHPDELHGNTSTFSTSGSI